MSAPADGAPPPRGRVLVVDDDPVVRRVTVLQLRRLGFAADAAADGAEGLAAVSRTAYDVVLLDCSMPVMDGHTMAREVRRLEAAGGRRLPIVGLTSSRRADERDLCLAAGMDDYLAKPADIQHVAATLDRWTRAAPPEPVCGSEVVSRAAIESLRAQFGADGDAVVAELLAAWAADAPRQAAALEAAEDADALRFAAHRLRGASRLLGGVRLADLCAEIEAAAGAGDVAAARTLARGVREVHRATDAALRGA